MQSESRRCTVILARHGEATYETEGSGTSGGSLTDDGRAQAAALGERLRGEHIAAVICSELSRAVQTAEIAAASLGLPVRVRMGLEEYDVGEERGQPYHPDVFEPLLLAWLHGDLSPGIPAGENGRQVARRMFAVLDDLADHLEGGTGLVVSHGGAIIAVLGTIAPGSGDLPRHAGDIPGGASFRLEQRPSGWGLVGSGTR